jgi:hypothetical protein
VTLMLSLVVQYYLGGVLRHFAHGWAWTAHPWFALAPISLAPIFAVASRRSGSPVLIRCATYLLGLIVTQALLGLLTWYFSKGVPAWGVVASRGSPATVLICSLHKVVGMLTLMSSVLSVVCAVSVQPSGRPQELNAADLDHSLVGAAT